MQINFVSLILKIKSWTDHWLRLVVYLVWMPLQVPLVGGPGDDPGHAGETLSVSRLLFQEIDPEKAARDQWMDA